MQINFYYAETSQIFHQDVQVLPKDIAMRNTTDMTGGKPIAVWLHSISDMSAFNPYLILYRTVGLYCMQTPE
jgi:hypothetical protein